MRKKIAAATIVAALSLSSVAMADPVKLSGETSIKYQRVAADGQTTKSGPIYTFSLKGESQLAANLSIFARIGAQHVTEPDFREFIDDGSGKKNTLSLDQLGLTYNNKGFTYTVGRQEVTVGKLLLLYSRDGYVGKHSFADGISVSGTAGAFNIAAVAAQENNYGRDDNKIYSARIGSGQEAGFSYGVTLARYDNKAAATKTNYRAVDGAYKWGKHELAAEFSRSSSDLDNKAFAVTWGYGPDEKTLLYVTSFRVEAQADMGGNSDFGANQRGIHYGLDYKFSANAKLESAYKDQKSISTGEKTRTLEVKMIYSF